jgi:hypothetical protein
MSDVVLNAVTPLFIYLFFNFSKSTFCRVNVLNTFVTCLRGLPMENSPHFNKMLCGFIYLGKKLACFVHFTMKQTSLHLG